jgi:hypothetical protein
MRITTKGALIAVAVICAGLAACVDPRDVDLDGFTQEEGDCNDDDATTHPEAIEIPGDGIDQRCNGGADEDQDHDGFSLDGTAGGTTDCNDVSPTVFPGAIEVLDGVDQNCDGVVDDHTEAWDDDGDEVSEAQGDCNDAAGDVHPLAPELADGIDNDCDHIVDEGTPVFDDDEDGYTEDEGDCDDANQAVYPGAPETGANVGLGDGLDNDCDALTDEGTWSYDDDGDGYSEIGSEGGASDCDDGDVNVAPNKVETPGDGIDNNCDGIFG